MFEMHPFHLHGYNFFVVGRGYGNYDPDSSLATFDVINPPFRNTYAMAVGSKVAIQFQADILVGFLIIKLTFYT
jgi:laccase